MHQYYILAGFSRGRFATGLSLGNYLVCCGMQDRASERRNNRAGHCKDTCKVCYHCRNLEDPRTRPARLVMPNKRRRRCLSAQHDCGRKRQLRKSKATSLLPAQGVHQCADCYRMFQSDIGPIRHIRHKHRT